ncbi:MAG: right-handed parallel beta-helix repeat-containing protein [Thermodesulfobacteriota bacterium]
MTLGRTLRLFFSLGMIGLLLVMEGLLSLEKACADPWQPPLGIPKPGWPSELNLSRPPLPNPWTSEQSGLYFVDPSGCSDARTHGYPSAPRCSLPSSPAAGSIIVLNGIISGSKNVAWSATSENPIWIMGYDPDNKPVLTNYWTITGAYIILDNLSWNYNSRDGVLLSGNHLFLRNCLYANPFDTANGAGFGINGSFIVYYNNTVSQMGNWQYTGANDIDRHGIKVFAPAADVWIVDSSFYHCHGDGVQVGDYNNTPEQINRIYLGRNTAYENYQCGFWTKNASDVIFSQNLVYHMKTASTYSRGMGLGGQYDAKQIWFISNTIKDCNVGIHIVGAAAGGGGPWYAIGNVIYNVEYPDGACSNYNAGALGYRNSGGFSALFNTVYNADLFVGIPYGAGGPLRVSNNIFSSKNSTHNDCPALKVDPSFTHDYNLFSLSSYDPGNEPHRQIEAADKTFRTPGSNFQIKASSLAVGKASPVEETAFSYFQSRYGIDLRRDNTGRSRPQGGGWDIGAFEAQLNILPSVWLLLGE